MATTVTPQKLDKSSDRVRDMFAQISPRYDLLNHLLSLNIDTVWRSETVKRVPPVGSDPILDLCTGTGDLAFAYRKVATSETPILAVDFCGEMLQVARQKQNRREVAGITFLEATALDLPFDDDFFQIVSVAFGLRNVEDTVAGLQQIYRVCKPGGKVAVLEFSKPEYQPFKGIYNAYFHHILPRVGQVMAKNDRSAYDYLPASVREFPSGEDLAGVFRSVGFKNVTCFPMTFGIVTLYVGSK